MTQGRLGTRLKGPVLGSVPSPRRFTFRKSSCFLESLDVGDEAGCIACHVTGRIFIVQAVARVRRGLGILKSGAQTL